MAGWGGLCSLDFSLVAPIKVENMSISKNAMFKSIRSSDLVLILLAALSLAILFLPKGWLTYSFELDPTKYPANITSEANGASEVRWLDKEKQIWHCDLDEHYKSAYCSLTINLLNERWQGIDFSRFNRMTIDADYQGSSKTVRVYLRNRHPRNFSSCDEMFTKYNLVEVPVEYLTEAKPFEMASFGVADWWLALKNIPLEYAHPEFKNVVFLEIQTGSFHKSMSNTIHIKKITWEGQLVSDEILYRVLAAVWGLTILGLLVVRMFQLNRDIKLNTRHQNELISINKLLNLQHKQFEELAQTDALTGLLNRIGIRDSLLAGVHNWNEKNEPFSVIIMDLDNFKNINDEFGHDVGDDVLVALANFIKRNVDESCFIGRWGGEEFILACKDSNLVSAQAVADNLRRVLEKTVLCHDISVTASFGVSTLGSPDLGQLFKNADDALYRAKSSGRNRVVTQDQLKSF